MSGNAIHWDEINVLLTNLQNLVPLARQPNVFIAVLLFLHHLLPPALRCRIFMRREPGGGGGGDSSHSYKDAAFLGSTFVSPLPPQPPSRSCFPNATILYVLMCACVCLYVRACVRVRACARLYVHVCAFVHSRAHSRLLLC